MHILLLIISNIYLLKIKCGRAFLSKLLFVKVIVYIYKPKNKNKILITSEALTLAVGEAIWGRFTFNLFGYFLGVVCYGSLNIWYIYILEVTNKRFFFFSFLRVFLFRVITYLEMKVRP